MTAPRGEAALGKNSRFLRINRDNPTPLYKQLEDLLRNEIETGIYSVGDLLPSEGEIGSRWDVSRSVVRQTLGSLAQQGIVRTEKGRGSFVAEHKVKQSFVQSTTGFFDELSQMGMRVETRVVKQEVVQVTGQAAEFLGVNEALEIARVRSVEGRIVTYVRTFLVPSECPGLEEVPLDDRSLYGVLAERYGIQVRSGSRTIEAVIAEGKVTKLLDVAEGFPILLLKSEGREEDGRPIEWFEAWHRADRTRFELKITPEASFAPLEQRVLPAGLSTWSHPTMVPASRFDAVVKESPIVVQIEGQPTFDDVRKAIERLGDLGVRIILLPISLAERLGPFEVIRSLRDDLVFGVASVNSASAVIAARGLRPDVIVSDVTFDLGAEGGHPGQVIFGGSTATEIHQAWERSKSLVQAVPAGEVSAFSQLARRLPDVPLMPLVHQGQGGFSSYLTAGAQAVAVTASIHDLDDEEFVSEIRACATASVSSTYRRGER